MKNWKICTDIASTFRFKLGFDIFLKLRKDASNFMFDGGWFHIFDSKDFKLLVPCLVLLKRFVIWKYRTSFKRTANGNVSGDSHTCVDCKRGSGTNRGLNQRLRSCHLKKKGTNDSDYYCRYYKYYYYCSLFNFGQNTNKW